MATKDDRPGLLSKVAMFVRNPTKDWSELDKPEQEQESGYDKQALKAMIERKRQNDFVRKREFDHLRKLRSRDPSAVAGLARPSFFQTSIPTDPDGRAMTLKKIDEIEAQMSRQWWKGKQDAAMAKADEAASKGTDDSESVTSAQFTPSQAVPSTMASEPFEPTESAELISPEKLQGYGEYAPTEMGAGMAPPMSSEMPLGSPKSTVPVSAATGALAASYDNSEMGFSASKLFAIDVDEMATDPELEEAAIRFANGDDAGAESGLINALASSAESPDVALSWAAALLDLYRATSNQSRFEWAVAEYAFLWTDAKPRWAALSDMQDAGTTTARSTLNANTASAALNDADATWSCPPVLTVEGMEDLREAMSGTPPPWHLGWGRLKQIGPDAMPLLGGLFSSLCDEPVSLRFSGADRLVSALRDIAPSGDRSVDASWWAVRLNALRTMQLHDEFELVALDYCITYEVSPPAWEPARCQYENAVGGSGASKQASGAYMAAPTAPMSLDAISPSDVELQGEVLGDATPALASMQERHVPGDQVIVSCRGLVRVDFSAAGSILNWVAMRQAEGSQVQFRDVHRLVAAFFNVIGINEHARVVPRSI